ncbi:dTDP-4-dehydrorhamnose reductase [Shewanella sp. 125m-1]
MRILITGAASQLAQALLSIAELTQVNIAQRTAAQQMLQTLLPEVSECLDPSDAVIGLCRQQLDICDIDSIRTAFDTYKPDVVINCAAYNRVDQAELDIEKAMSVNANGPKLIASECHSRNICMVHISTDFVFDGVLKRPYVEQDPAAPLSIYGKSKLEGERWVSDILGFKAKVIRTSWLYSCRGHNFVKTMQGLFKVKDKLAVIADQYGSPTWCEALAVMILKLVKQTQTQTQTLGSKVNISRLTENSGAGVCNLYHYAGGASCSWFELAGEIQRLTLSFSESESESELEPEQEPESGLEVNIRSCKIEPISTLAWQALHKGCIAQRPHQSALSAQKLCQQLDIKPESLLRASWQEQLHAMIKEQNLRGEAGIRKNRS